ncbi:MAG: tagatose-6-phosphate kinase [Chloroflexi bacterium]|nr:tagatose-6-phosphate kinase [Chloroflexota bacterium]MBL77167.1 tagatose-6-phosphate kinase [Chloroflexota bacterium]|tara:strand:+ start:23166 stop:24305 length:1140 start_codon:yes stop_codon:yes gene_type:complete
MITKSFLKNPKLPLIGIGPMSKNCVDASIELSNKYNLSLMLIASRRQVESIELGRGYVNNWSTEEFSSYVRKKDKKKKIILCRDHGGPWQNDKDKKQKISLKRAMLSAKKSFKTDIDNNFKILHIDVSEDPRNSISDNEKLNRIFELYEYCIVYAKKRKKEIFIEINFGKEDGGIDSPLKLKKNLKKIQTFCEENTFPTPTFLVIRNGNHVLETQNVGQFEKIFKKNSKIKQSKIINCINLCNTFKIMSKIHNADYITNHSIKLHKKIGVHGMNFAPEFGVAETIAFLKILDDNKLDQYKKQFISLAYDSKKWKKWMIKNSNTKKFDKAIISGHYIFSTPEFIEIKKNCENIIGKKIDPILKNEIKKSILRYLQLLQLL